jgi:hypothetical protein
MMGVPVLPWADGRKSPVSGNSPVIVEMMVIVVRVIPAASNQFTPYPF